MRELTTSEGNDRLSEGSASGRATSDARDRFEKEADRAADLMTERRSPRFDFSRLSLMANSADLSSPASNEKQPEEANEPEETMPEDTDEAMLKSAGNSEPGTLNGDATSVLRSPGRPLDSVTRRLMESHFARDFGRVRIHTDDSAIEGARSLNAHAFTLGEHMGFASNEYQPHTTRGQHLIAHELAHTIQQKDHHNHSPQCAEFGTYVSTKGDQSYLDAGASYYKEWGFPNVKRVSSVKDVLDDLDRARGTIDRFRIVSHGRSEGIELGGVPGLSTLPTEGWDRKDWFTKKGAEFSTEERFRKHFTESSYQTLVSEAFFQRIIGDLRKDKTMLPILTRLGADQNTPSGDSPLGIVLRALVDRLYLGKVQLDTGGAPTFTNRGVLDQFINGRISTFRPIAVHAVVAAQQPDVEKAIGEFSGTLSASFDATGLHFNDVTADEAKTLADTYLEPGASSAKLSTDIATTLGEAKEGGGSFLKKLQSVKGKIGAGTHIEVRGCSVGEDTGTLDQFREFFGEAGKLPSISAPDLFQYFFQLNFSTFTQNPTDVAGLESAFTTSDTGVERTFEDRRRLQAGEMMRVVNEPSLDAMATKYGLKVADLERWNPQILDATKLSPGDEVWLAMRPSAPAGKHKTLKAFCKDYLGDEKAEADVRAENAQINADALVDTDVIKIPASRQAAKIAAPKPKVADFVASIRAGDSLTAINSQNKPVTYLDDPKRASSLATWLAKQQFDPKGRTAAQLSALYAGGSFSAQAAKTYINFLSRSYPNIVDPIFPDDQRYSKHIIKRP